MAALGSNMKGRSKKASAITVTAKQPKKRASKPESVKKPLEKITAKPGLRNAQLILEPSKRKKIRKIRIILEGDLNINNVDQFRAQIEPIFKDYDFVDFNQREVTSIDLPHIQLMHYFQNHFKKKGKTVTVDADLSVDMKKVVVGAGFKELMFVPKLV